MTAIVAYVLALLAFAAVLGVVYAQLTGTSPVRGAIGGVLSFAIGGSLVAGAVVALGVPW